MNVISESTLELNGLSFRVRIVPDEGMGAPWKEHDGHGVVTDWTNRPKHPGERVLNADHGSFRYYDFAASLKIALRDGWGAEKRDQDWTKHQIAAAAVEADYQRLKEWCDDEWSWICVDVTLMDADGNEIDRPECQGSLCGIESDSPDYHAEVAKELAEEIASTFDGKNSLCIPLRKGVA